MPDSFTQSNFSYGGQAVIEGVMMRGARALSVAVRNPAGEIVVHTEELDPRIYGGRLARIPFLRGLTLLWDALGLGIKSLMFSAEVALEDEEDEAAGKVFEGPLQWGTVVLSLSMAIGLFFVLPAFVAGQLEIWLDLSHVVSSIVEGGIKLGLLIGYIWLIGFMPDIRRLYGYHGAEHKTINAYEAGSDLEPEIVSQFSVQHPRCGTAFLLTVVVLSIFLFALFPGLSIPLRILSRILLLPVIAGISYEFIRFTARHQENAFVRFIIKPNLALQRLTTREPDLEMLAVAITAFERILSFEHGISQDDAIQTPLIADASSAD
jgi:uncharacterized protein YqhQ